jgi:ABC transport system ATP-binding/permease protein
MPPEHSDWPSQQPQQAGPVPGGLAPAGLAEAGPRQPGPVVPALVVRTRREDHTLHAGTTYRIGRDPASDIAVGDSRVSWRHAVLRAEGGGWVLEDVGSTNGTFVGLERVQRVVIASDCVVRLGNAEDGPVLRCMPQAAAAPARGAAAPRERPAAAPAPADVSGGPRTPVGPARPVEPLLPVESVEPLLPVEPALPAWAAAPAAPPKPAAQPEPVPPREPVLPREPARPREAAAGAAGRELLPSVDRRPTARMPLPAKAMRIGRDADNDLVLSDLEVSRHHAELRRSPTGAYQIVDLSSHNGIYVNGQQVSSAVLSEADIVSIGRSTFRLAGGELRQFVDEGEVTFSAQDLVVKVGGGKILLDHVTFPIPEKSLLAVIGPSGAGKSTLLGALTGMRPADTGSVLYDNRDLYRNYDELRHRIGLVPQQSVLHTQLTARRALQYTAELRFPADTRAPERDGRVDEVIGELDLTKHAQTRAERLSGGQLKRVNVAQELLTKPSLLFLDEPTSGLDPNLDKQVMEQMRDLAHDGRTVIVVTHSVAHLDICDRLLVLYPGGRIAFYGPPAEGLSYFGLPGWAEVFEAFERYPDRDWAGEFKASPAYAAYVLGRRPRPAPTPQKQQLLPEQNRPRGALRQMSTLTRRYLRVIAADRGYLLFMGLLPVILGVLIHLVGTSQGLAGPPHTNQNAQETLLLLVICACLSGAASSVRELVKERDIYIRERAAGLSCGAYLWSKLLVLGVISIVQSFVLVLLGLGGRPLPPTGSLLTSLPLVELLLGVSALAVASMCLGLLVSSLVSTSEKAMPFLVLLTMIQVILSGGVLSLSGKAGLTQLAWLAPARWGFGAVASTSNLNVINPSAGNFTDPLWNHTAKTWLIDMGLTIALAVIYALLTWLKLRRIGPRPRKA